MLRARIDEELILSLGSTWASAHGPYYWAPPRTSATASADLPGHRHPSQRFPGPPFHLPVHLNPNVLGRQPTAGQLVERSADALRVTATSWRSWRVVGWCCRLGWGAGRCPLTGETGSGNRDTTERPEGVAAGTAILTGSKASRSSTCGRLLTDETAYRSMATARIPTATATRLSGLWSGFGGTSRRRGALRSLGLGKADRIKQDHRVTQSAWDARQGGETLATIPRPYRAGATAT